MQIFLWTFKLSFLVVAVWFSQTGTTLSVPGPDEEPEITTIRFLYAPIRQQKHATPIPGHGGGCCTSGATDIAFDNALASLNNKFKTLRALSTTPVSWPDTMNTQL